MTIFVATRFGTMECLESDSIVSTSLMRYGEWAQSELDLLSRIILPGHAALDVGAFLGTHTLALSRMVGLGGRIHSFEPRKDIREILERNITNNSLLNVVLHPCALGSADAVINIPAIDISKKGNFGGLSIDVTTTTNQGATEEILIRRLDDFAFDRLDFIKIDAEGMEAAVIAGGHGAIQRFRPILFAECNDLQNGYQTLQQFIGLDYQVYGVSSLAFNPDNYKALKDNIFGTALEISLLAVPVEKVKAISEHFELVQLPRICGIDDLNLLMLQKPQYPDEVLARCSAGLVLGLDYPSPLSRRLSADHSGEIALLKGIITDLEYKISVLRLDQRSRWIE